MKETADTEKCPSVAVKSLRALRGTVTAVATRGIAAERRQAKQAVAERAVEEAE